MIADSPRKPAAGLFTPDGRYIVVRGRLWRAANPHLSPERREALVRQLMDARRAVAAAKRADDTQAESAAHAAVGQVKVALGERGAPWWSDGTPDLNRHMARNTDYAAWYGGQAAGGNARFLVGTAGWSIPKALAGEFAAAGTHLARYAGTMAAVEINSSFYRPHRRATYERWAAATPENFRFSAKLPKEITHARRLADVEEPLDAFLQQVGGLGARLGVVLVQLPPSLGFEPDIAPAFLKLLRARVDPAVAVAVEPRHPSWFSARADDCMAEHRAARVSADPVLAPSGEQAGGWAGLVYRRLHGSPRVYYSAYDKERLVALAEAMARERAAAVPSWCIFDNTASGAALADALGLLSLLARSARPDSA